MFRSSFLMIAPVIGISMDAHGQHPVLLVLGVVLCSLCLFGLGLFLRTKDLPLPQVAAAVQDPD